MRIPIQTYCDAVKHREGGRRALLARHFGVSASAIGQLCRSPYPTFVQWLNYHDDVEPDTPPDEIIRVLRTSSGE